MRRYWFVVLIIVLLLILASCQPTPGLSTPTQVPSPPTQVPSPSTQAPSAPAPSPTSAPLPAPIKKVTIGEDVSNSKVMLTVHSVKFYDQITGGLGNIYKPKQEGDIFAIVDLSIKNVSASAIEINPSYCRLLDSQNKPCPQAVLIIAGWPYELKKLTGEQLTPGEQRRGMVVFTTKQGAVLDKVSYTTPTPAIDVSLEGLIVSVPEYRMPRVGEVARGGGIEMRVSSVGSIEKLKQEYGDERFKLIWTETAKEGQQLVVIDIGIKNVIIEPSVTINPLNVLIVDTESKAYGRVALAIALEGQLHVCDLSPGQETAGRLLFSAPAGVGLDRVMYKIGALGPPVQVSLR